MCWKANTKSEDTYDQQSIVDNENILTYWNWLNGVYIIIDKNMYAHRGAQ